MSISNELLVVLVVGVYVGVVASLDVSPTRIRWWWTRFFLGTAILYGIATGDLGVFLLIGGAIYLSERSTPPWTFRLRSSVFGE